MKKNVLSFAFMLLAAVFGDNRAMAQEVPHVYINPGHGGHDSDDRNVVIPPFAQGDTLGFWESNSNLWKGFAYALYMTYINEYYGIGEQNTNVQTSEPWHKLEVVELNNGTPEIKTY
ncbi:MAG: hypothetical protein II034_05820, partial [Muribaculaceae bacterium]|nr:hypothetical protein [Muribaculaceae bacterium]